MPVGFNRTPFGVNLYLLGTSPFALAGFAGINNARAPLSTYRLISVLAAVPGAPAPTVDLAAGSA